MFLPYIVLLGSEDFQVAALQILQWGLINWLHSVRGCDCDCYNYLTLIWNFRAAGVVDGNHIIIGTGNVAQSLNQAVGKSIGLYDGLIVVRAAWNRKSYLRWSYLLVFGMRIAEILNIMRDLVSDLPEYDEFFSQYSTLPRSTYVESIHVFFKFFQNGLPIFNIIHLH